VGLRILGPLEARAGDRRLELGGSKQRAVLGRLGFLAPLLGDVLYERGPIADRRLEELR
jgi:hypothetical protein